MDLEGTKVGHVRVGPLLGVEAWILAAQSTVGWRRYDAAFCGPAQCASTEWLIAPSSWPPPRAQL